MKSFPMTQVQIIMQEVRHAVIGGIQTEAVYKQSDEHNYIKNIERLLHAMEKKSERPGVRET